MTHFGFLNYSAPIGEQDIVSLMTQPRVMQSAESPFKYTLSSAGSGTSTSFRQIDEMNVERTAAWIRMLGSSKGWTEANQYAESFRNNNIMGYLLEKLTMQSLKSDLNIFKYGHRIEIMEAITQLWPEGEEVSSFQKSEYGRYNSNSVSRMVNSVKHSMQQANEVRKWVKPGTDSRNKAYNSMVPVNPAECNSTTKSEQSKTEPAKEKSKRARPGNHIAYKARQDVAIKRGKSCSSIVVGHLLEGSIVLINQIKGRKGRIVQRKENGELVNIGWVSLFTNDSQQLMMKKYWKKGGVIVKNSDAIIQWTAKSPLDENSETLGDNGLKEETIPMKVKSHANFTTETSKIAQKCK